MMSFTDNDDDDDDDDDNDDDDDDDDDNDDVICEDIMTIPPNIKAKIDAACGLIPNCSLSVANNLRFALIPSNVNASHNAVNRMQTTAQVKMDCLGNSLTFPFTGSSGKSRSNGVFSLDVLVSSNELSIVYKK